MQARFTLELCKKSQKTVIKNGREQETQIDSEVEIDKDTQSVTDTNAVSSNQTDLLYNCLSKVGSVNFF